MFGAICGLSETTHLSRKPPAIRAGKVVAAYTQRLQVRVWGYSVWRRSRRGGRRGWIRRERSRASRLETAHFPTIAVLAADEGVGFGRIPEA